MSRLCDPYLSIERARPSIDQIHGARLYEVPGGHAPWLVDAQRAAELIATKPAVGNHPPAHGCLPYGLGGKQCGCSKDL
jgi:hypothetical protein